MTSFPNSPKLIKGGIVLVDPILAMVQRIVTLQYNPETLTRSFQIQGAGGEGGDRSEALRLTGPSIETIKLDVEIDATDQLEFPDDNPDTVEYGIHPQLAALETLIHPSSTQLISNNILSHIGTVEILPMETSLSLFIWSKNRILPVRITEFSITEEAFDPSLNPIRAKVSLGMRVLRTDDLGILHTGSSLFMNYLQAKEDLMRKDKGGVLSTFGIGGVS
ncbi:MAG: hypothetical protein GQ537_06665 [Gammaproteobacteria bacterium]|jgi:hypothetical protein|nr:hypothetical protein [Gammaproteobacteria bacterium]